MDRIARDRLGAKAAAGRSGIAPDVTGNQICLVGIVGIERAPASQRLQQDFTILLRHGFVEPSLLRRLGQQFRNLALEVHLDVANALRNAAEGAGGVQERVVVKLDERLKRRAETLAVIEKRAVVIGNPPWPGIDVESRFELARLPDAAEF